jgi:hypothetical protein
VFGKLVSPIGVRRGAGVLPSTTFTRVEVAGGVPAPGVDVVGVVDDVAVRVRVGVRVFDRSVRVAVGVADPPETVVPVDVAVGVAVDVGVSDGCGVIEP